MEPGEVGICPTCGGTVTVKLVPAPSRPVIKRPLTPKELDVLELRAQGYGNKEIARRLGNSTQTIKNHCSKILEKTHSTRMEEAIAKAKDFFEWRSTVIPPIDKPEPG